MKWLTGSPVPQYSRLPLVSDANRFNVARFQSGHGQRAARNLQLAGPNFTRVMLDPSRLWKNLSKLLLGHASNCAILIENNRARAGRALIQSQNEGHNKLRCKTRRCPVPSQSSAWRFA